MASNREHTPGGPAMFVRCGNSSVERLSEAAPKAAFHVFVQPMELDGTIEANLAAAIRSARRLRGHPVHSDTLNYWRDLLHHARRELSACSAPEATKQLIVDLETEMAERTSAA